MDSTRTSTARKALQAKQSGTSGLAAAKSNVVQQAKLMDSAGTAWHAVKYGNLEMITRLFPSQCNVYSKGPVGDNVFHIAMLLNTPSTLAIAKYLVKLYGKTLVNTPYQERKAESDSPGQYEGETALHIAIVNHDFDMVKFLVQNGADVRARAYGSFFQPGSAVYYGEFPLSFAACTGQKDIVSYLKRHGARVNHDRDQWGNTALHMCVTHDQPDMYDHLVEYCGASEHVQNNRSQTPLLLAASLGKVGMLQHIYSKRRRVAWAYGPVTSYSLSLREIDTVQNPGEYVPSAIETSVRKGHLEVLEDPLVQTLLATKWSRFGRTTFLVQVLAYLTYVLSQTFLVWLISDTKLWNSSERFAMEVLGVVLGALFFLVDVVDFGQWTAGVFRRRKLMKAASKYRPALYPIPGERLETMTTQKSNFLTRLIASNRQNTAQQQQQGGQPVAEGAELPGAAAQQPQQQEDMQRWEGGGEVEAGRWRAPPAAASSVRALACGGAGGAGVVIEEVLDEEAAGVPAAAGGLTASAAAALEAAAAMVPAGGATVSVQLACAAPYSAAASGGAGTCPPAAGAAAAPYSAAALAARGGDGDSDSDGEWHGAAARGGAGAGPVAEGTEGPQASGPSATGGVSPFATAVGAAAAPPPPPPPPPAAAAAAPGSMAAMQQLYSQLAAGGGGGALAGGGGGGTAATLAALQQQVAALQQVRAAAAAGGGVSSSFTGAGAQHLVGAMASLSAVGGGGAGLLEPVDFVSVGLGPGPMGAMPGGLMGGRKNSFAAVQQAPKVTSMLRAPDAPTNDVANRDSQAHGRTSNPHLSGLNRAPSLGGSVGEGGEIRNRMRGGGGDNVSGGLPRAATRRQTTNIASAEPGTYDGGGGGGGDATAAAADEEPQPDRTPTWLRHVQTLLHAYRGYVKRMIQDPIQFVHVFHHSATLVHFIIWAATYGGVGGAGPANIRLLEFDDVVVSLMALSGWVSMLYYSRGVQAVGQLVVLLERCWWEVVKFVCLYFIANIGFTLAFYTCANGATSAVLGDEDRMTALGLSMWDPMGNIGYGMITMVRFLYGEASYEGIAVVPNHQVKTAFATIYWLLYVAVVLLLLGNVMTAMIMYVYSHGWADAEKKWRLRWAQYVLRAEARMPTALQQRTRLGEVSYDPVLATRVYNHVFEVVEDGREKEEEREAQVKALEAAIDKIRAGAKRDSAKRG